MFGRGCFPKALSVEQRTCTSWQCLRRPPSLTQACVSNSASLKFSSGRPTLGSRICDVLSNENIWAWAGGGSRCGACWIFGGNQDSIWSPVQAAELSPNIGVHSTVFTRRLTASPAYHTICRVLRPTKTHYQGKQKQKQEQKQKIQKTTAGLPANHAYQTICSCSCLVLRPTKSLDPRPTIIKASLSSHVTTGFDSFILDKTRLYILPILSSQSVYRNLSD